MDRDHSPLLRLATEAVRRGDWVSAETQAIAVLAEEPLSAEAYRLLGTAYSQTGRVEEAIEHLERSVALQTCPAWLNNLGVLYAVASRWRDAARVFKESLESRPQDLTALCHYGRSLCELRQFLQARTILENVVAADPMAGEAWTDLGWTLLETGEHVESYEALHRAATLVTDSRRSLQLLLRVCRVLHRPSERAEHAQTLAANNPNAETLTELALALWESGDLPNALSSADKAFSYGVGTPDLHSGLLYLFQFDPEQSGKSLAEAHFSWAVTHCRYEVNSAGVTGSPPHAAKLRIGYLAANLLTSPARYSRLPLIANADTDRFDVYVYGTQPASEREAALHQSLPGIYRNVYELSDEQLLGLIRTDALDVLVDLVGHHNFGRLRVFGQRAAPVQVAYGTYPGTTGLREFDHFLTDESTSPSGTEGEYSERLWRMPTGYLMYAPPPVAPVITGLPARRNNFVTFGVFQREAKLNEPYYDVLAKILKATPDSRLLVHHESPGFDSLNDERPQRVLSALEARGICPTRVRFQGKRLMDTHLSVLSEADIALDTFPYNGHTITCECLWMGVPVVVLVGNRHAGRIGAGLLRQVRLDRWIARSIDEYVNIAVDMARELTHLEILRAGLREQVASSTLVDTKTRTGEIENVFRECVAGLKANPLP